jgi:polygalacturonase
LTNQETLNARTHRKRVPFSAGTADAVFAGPLVAGTGPAVFNVKDYGATGKKADKARVAIQQAIDSCAAAGGGVVYLPPGEYTSGTLHLRSHVRFHLEAGATLKELWNGENLAAEVQGGEEGGEND